MAVSYTKVRSGHSNWRGYWETIKAPNGGEITISGSTPEELARNIQRELIALTKAWSDRRYPDKRKSVPRKERVFNEQELKQIGNRLASTIEAGTKIGHLRTLDAISFDFMKNAIDRRGFNSFTGNLVNAYVTNIVHKGRVAERIWYDDIYDQIKKGQHVGRRAYIQDRVHPDRGIRSNLQRRKTKRRYLVDKAGRIYRYIKKWEKISGYRSNYAGDNNAKNPMDPGIAIARQHTLKSGFGYDERYSSGLILENVAPYAGAVQQQGYNVLAHARMRFGNYRAKQAQLVQIATRDMLRKAGFKIK